MRRRFDRVRAGGAELGTVTAEFAVVMVAAVGFAGLLLTILGSGAVRGLLLGIVRRALTT